MEKETSSRRLLWKLVKANGSQNFEKEGIRARAPFPLRA